MGEWMQLAVKEWRVRFTVAGRDVRVHEIHSGFQAAQLTSSKDAETRQPHREFNVRWPPR